MNKYAGLIKPHAYEKDTVIGFKKLSGIASYIKYKGKYIGSSEVGDVKKALTGNIYNTLGGKENTRKIYITLRELTEVVGNIHLSLLYQQPLRKDKLTPDPKEFRYDKEKYDFILPTTGEQVRFDYKSYTEDEYNSGKLSEEESKKNTTLVGVADHLSDILYKLQVVSSVLAEQGFNVK